MKIKIKNSSEISDADLANMYVIYEKSYHTSFQEFKEKKNTIDAYALYMGKGGELVGFTGIRDHTVHLKKTKYRCYYIGQTIIKESFRGNSLIQKTITKLVFLHYLKTPLRKVIIWNDSLTYRPYLLIARDLKYYHPSPDIYVPELEIIRNELGAKYYGDAYNKETGVVKKSKVILSSEELTISSEKLENRFVQYYVQQNPTYYKGDGLITVSTGDFRNIVYYFSKGFYKKPKKQFHEVATSSLSA